MEMLVILTLAKPAHGGLRQLTLTRTMTVAPGTTRADLLGWMLDQCLAEHPQMQGGNIVFFCAEANHLPSQLKAVKS
ncbi:hypothetical protein [Planomonospora sp. ID67723]|uniref:hypothetical protein n=1 Tax=Planomonospora sp. ID67723 TaxID=2738134 RepID=UPI001E522E35|nr:hypothetical protein [Planomonospora sp. ID67723]